MEPERTTEAPPAESVNGSNREPNRLRNAWS